MSFKWITIKMTEAGRLEYLIGSLVPAIHLLQSITAI